MSNEYRISAIANHTAKYDQRLSKNRERTGKHLILSLTLFLHSALNP